MILKVGLFIPSHIFCALVILLLGFGETGAVIQCVNLLMVRVWTGDDLLLDALRSGSLHLVCFLGLCETLALIALLGFIGIKI